jgi:hypothetical protein
MSKGLHVCENRKNRRPDPGFRVRVSVYAVGGNGGGGGGRDGALRFGARSTWLALIHSASTAALFAYLFCMIASSLRSRTIPRAIASSIAARDQKVGFPTVCSGEIIEE